MRVNIFETSEQLFRKQLQEMLTGLDSDGTGFLSIKLTPITTVAKEALTDAAGLLVFDSDLGKLCVNNGAGWETVTST